MENIENILKNIAQTGKRLYEKGFSPGFSGNISVKHGDKIFITPSGFNLGDVGENDVVEIDFNGNAVGQNLKPSSERFMHIEIYKRRPDVSSIIHCHAPKSSAFAVAGIPLSAPILAENVFTIGPVPIVEYSLPSTTELAIKTADCFLSHDAVLMANHGVTVVGKNIEEAYYKTETLEYYADVFLLSKILGRSNELPDEEVQKILDLKNKK